MKKFLMVFALSTSVIAGNAWAAESKKGTDYTGETEVAIGTTTLGSLTAAHLAALHTNAALLESGGALAVLPEATAGTLLGFGIAAAAGGYAIGDGINHLDEKYFNSSLRKHLVDGIEKGVAVSDKIKKDIPGFMDGLTGAVYVKNRNSDNASKAQ